MTTQILHFQSPHMEYRKIAHRTVHTQSIVFQESAREKYGVISAVGKIFIINMNIYLLVYVNIEISSKYISTCFQSRLFT